MNSDTKTTLGIWGVFAGLFVVGVVLGLNINVLVESTYPTYLKICQMICDPEDAEVIDEMCFCKVDGHFYQMKLNGEKVEGN